MGAILSPPKLPTCVVYTGRLRDPKWKKRISDSAKITARTVLKWTPMDTSELTPEIPFMASLWIRSGCDMKVGKSAETYQVGAHFKALIKAILVAPSRTLEKFFSFHVSLPRCVLWRQNGGTCNSQHLHVVCPKSKMPRGYPGGHEFCRDLMKKRGISL